MEFVSDGADMSEKMTHGRSVVSCYVRAHDLIRSDVSTSASHGIPSSMKTCVSLRALLRGRRKGDSDGAAVPGRHYAESDGTCERSR